MELKGQATSVARIALSYMMMALSRIRVASLWVTSMTNSENTLGTYATLRFAGDALDPDEISSILRTQPTRAYRKGQKYSPGPRSPEVIGKTGIWYFSTKYFVSSKNLAEHLGELENLISPFADDGRRLRELRDVMGRKNLQAHVTCFWRGIAGAMKPSISSAVTRTFDRLPADIEADFDTEES